MKLTRDQRARLLAEDYSPLVFEKQPRGCEKGTMYVLSWSRPRSTHDGLGNTFHPSSEPMRWITVTAITRRAKGGWAVRFDITDRRQPRRLLRASPPVWDPKLMQEDNIHPPTQAEREEAAEESAYTSNPASAADYLDAPQRGYKPPEATAMRRRQAKLLKEAQRERLSMGRQLDSLLEDARESRMDVRSRARKIQREIELLQRDLQERAA